MSESKTPQKTENNQSKEIQNEEVNQYYLITFSPKKYYLY